MQKIRLVQAVMAAVVAVALAILAVPATATAAGAPNPPRSLRVTAVTFDSVSLAWDPAVDHRDQETFYQVLVDGQWRSGSYTTTVTLSQLVAGRTYRIEVRTLDTLSGVPSTPIRATVSTLSDTVAPTTPGNLRISRDANGAPAALVWDASADNRGVGGYRLLNNGVPLFGTRATSISFADLTDTFCVLEHGQAVTITVRATDLTGISSTPSQPVSVVVP